MVNGFGGGANIAEVVEEEVGFRLKVGLSGEWFWLREGIAFGVTGAQVERGAIPDKVTLYLNTFQETICDCM